MSKARDVIIELGHQLAEEQNAAADLWTWLPSHRRAQAGHGDQAHEHRPSVCDVIIEASTFLSHRMKPTVAQAMEAGEIYQCTCGEHHELPEDRPTTAGAVSLHEAMRNARADLDRFEAAYLAGHRANPDQYPLELPANNAGLWIEFLHEALTGSTD